jgi:serine/threonine protein kinase
VQPENIALKEKDGKVLKIIDFGAAQDLSVNPKPQVMVGTPEFIGELQTWILFTNSW